MTPELIYAAVRLADTLARENAALSALDLAGATRLLDDKAGAMRAFGAASEAALKVTAPVGRPQLREVARRLAVLTAENRRLLERAMLVQGRVIGTIARAVPRALANEARGYRRDGGFTQARHLPAVALSASA